MSDTIYVIGSLNTLDVNDSRNNREVVFVPDGEETDLPAAAAYSYVSTLTKFPYTTS
jgi:hypothetical protein